VLAAGALDGVSAELVLTVDGCDETAATVAVVVAWAGVVAASTATTPVLSAAAAAVACVILTIRRRAAFRSACLESGGDGMPPSNEGARRSP
jgi:hypothetical protein